jgi:maltokinase
MSTIRDVEATLGTALPSWLPRQRWFGGKGRSITGVTLADLAWLDGDAHDEAIAIVAVRYAGAEAEHYALWLSLRGPAEVPDTGGAIGPLNDDAAGRLVVEAAADARPGSALWRTLRHDDDVPTANGGRLVVADLTGAAGNAFHAPPTVRTLGAEQSNTSIRVGDTLVFKLFRRLQIGENPELEVCRFLSAHTAFDAVPSLHGSVTYVSPAGEAATLAVVQGWISNQGDGWQHVVSRLEREVSQPGAWAAMVEELSGLGAVTAAFHVASASDASVSAFAPVPVTAEDVARWTADVVARAARVGAPLADAALDAETRRRLAPALDRVAARDLAPAPSIDGPGRGFSRIRIHGDYHLGQTLKTTGGFVLIDFEGEPTRTLDERRAPHCALKDVAGMLRSFEYALAVAARAAHGGGAPTGVALQMTDAFLTGYFGALAASPVAFLPADLPSREGWLRFFVLEKALYELEYELNNRPDWVLIPAQALLRILDV